MREQIQILKCGIDASEVDADVFVIPMEQSLLNTTGGVGCGKFLSQWSKGRKWVAGDDEMETNSARMFSWDGLKTEPRVVFVNVPIGTDFVAKFEKELACCFVNVLKETMSCDAISSIAIPHFPSPPGVDERLVARVAVASAVSLVHDMMVNHKILFCCGDRHLATIYREAMTEVLSD